MKEKETREILRLPPGVVRNRDVPARREKIVVVVNNKVADNFNHRSAPRDYKAVLEERQIQKTVDLNQAFLNHADALQEDLEKDPYDIDLHIDHILHQLDANYPVQAEILYDYVSSMDNISLGQREVLEKIRIELSSIKRVPESVANGAPQFGQNRFCLSLGDA